MDRVPCVVLLGDEALDAQRPIIKVVQDALDGGGEGSVGRSAEVLRGGRRTTPWRGGAAESEHPASDDTALTHVANATRASQDHKHDD